VHTRAQSGAEQRSSYLPTFQLHLCNFLRPRGAATQLSWWSVEREWFSPEADGTRGDTKRIGRTTRSGGSSRNLRQLHLLHISYPYGEDAGLKRIFALADVW